MFQRIMIAMDSSPQATLALKVARAHFPDSERRLLTVLDERTLPLPSPEQPARTREELIAEAQTALLALTLTQESCKTVVGERVPTLSSDRTPARISGRANRRRRTSAATAMAGTSCHRARRAALP